MSTVIDGLPAPDEIDHPEDGGARWRLDNGWVVVAYRDDPSEVVLHQGGPITNPMALALAILAAERFSRT